MKAKLLLLSSLLMTPITSLAQLTDIERLAIVEHIADNMVRVEGGTFQMGSNSWYEHEKPAHQVTLSSFSICRFAVTQREWKAVMGSTPSKFKDSDDLPVENVSWEDCLSFIAKLNKMTGKSYRLPTEAEWEFAARGGNSSHGYDYAGSDDPATVAWHGKSNEYGDSTIISVETTHPVGTRAPNELGLYDMSGNLWERCSDWYEDYSSAAQTNPSGPPSGSYRVRRGGCWGSDAEDCRISNRDWSYPSGDSFDGLRLAL